MTEALVAPCRFRTSNFINYEMVVENISTPPSFYHSGCPHECYLHTPLSFKGPSSLRFGINNSNSCKCSSPITQYHAFLHHEIKHIVYELCIPLLYVLVVYFIYNEAATKGAFLLACGSRKTLGTLLPVHEDRLLAFPLNSGDNSLAHFYLWPKHAHV